MWLGLRNRLIATTALCREGEGTGAGGPPPGGPPAAPALAAPWGGDVNAQWMLGETGKQQPWFEALPAGPTKDFIKSKNYGNPAVMADALYSANRMVNGNAVELPSIDSAPDAWNAFNAKLRGDSIKAAADYKFSFGKDDAGNEVQADPKMLQFAQSLAFDLGVSPKRAQELIVDKWQAFAKDYNTAQHAAMVQENEAEANAVKTQWGANFDTLRAAGERAVKALGLSQADMGKIEGAIGASAIMNLFAKLGSLGSEGGLPSGDPSKSSDPSAMTPQGAQAEIDRMRADAAIGAALVDRNNPQHNVHTERLQQLYAIIAGGNKRPA